MGSAWYVGKGRDRRGPFTSGQLREMATSGELLPTDLIWKDGMSGWVPASKTKGLFPARTPVSGPPPIPARTT